MATFAVGDIHGNFPALRDLLDAIRPQLSEHDTVVFLGDYIDRGSGSKQCVDTILEFTGSHNGPTVCLSGNHEDWMMRSYRDHTAHSWLLGMKGFSTIGSYSADAEIVLRAAASRAGTGLYQDDALRLPYDMFFEAMPAAHLQFFETLRLTYDDPQGIYVHAGFDSRLLPEAQTRDAVLFGRNDGGFPGTYLGARVVVYGHRNNPILDAEGWPSPRVDAHTIGLDTSHHGVVSAVRLPDRRVFQSGRFLEGGAWRMQGGC